MSAMTDNKQSTTPKIAAPSADQDAIRRAKKARQRTNGGHTPRTTEGYLQGSLSDKVKTRALAMLDKLEGAMSSSAPSVHRQLSVSVISYIEAFSKDGALNHQDRHSFAKQMSLDATPIKLRAYTSKQLNHAFSSTWPRR